MNLKNIFRALKLTWQFDKKYIFIKVLIVIITTTVSFITLSVSKMIIDVLVNNTNSLKYGIFLLLISTLLCVVSTLVTRFTNQYFPKVNIKLDYHLQKNLINKVSKIDYCNFDNPEFYDDMERALFESSGLTKSLDIIISIFSSLINLGVAIILCLHYDYIIPLILVLAITPYWIVKQKLNKYSYDVSKEISSIGRKSSAVRHLMTSKYYAHEVRSYDLSSFLLKKYSGFAHDRIKLTVDSNRKKNIYTFWLSVLQIIINALSSGLLIFYVIEKLITIGEYTLLQSYVIKMQTSLNSLLEALLNVSERNLYLDNLFKFIDEADKAINSHGTIDLDRSRPHKIEFRNVSFKYPNSNKLILDDVSFIINPGDAVMLIGENGAGKSTMLMLLNSFYYDYSGEILIDDINIRKIKPESVWCSISMMFQGGNLLPISLKENLVFDGHIEENVFADYPWFEHLINKFPNGLDTIMLTYMYRDGVQPSGGETQQIKLMRTILKEKTGCIVMDEPSNALDPETEYNILSSIKLIAKQKTAIIVSHKLSCAIYVDKIIHLKNGKIVEQGSHEQLLATDGEYSRLFKLQAENYTSNEDKTKAL